jgi:hypothetical protein
MPIATVDDLIAYTGKRVDDPTTLEIFIDTAYEILCNYIGYNLEINFISEYVNGYGNNKLQLKHKPVSLVYSVTDYMTGENLYLASHSIGNDYIINNEFVDFKDIVFPRNKLIVEYVYGYGLLDFAANVFGGSNASTTDFFATAFCGNALDHTIFETIFGGGANNIGVIETMAVPSVFKQTILRIAALLLSEADSNIGVTSKSFGDSGTRTFINFTNFDKYLQVLSKYRLVTI